MGTIRVRVDAGQVRAEEPATGVRGEVKERTGRRTMANVIPFDTSDLAASLQDLTGELSTLFADIRRVGQFELEQVQVGLEISAEGGFNLIGSAKAGGKGAITLTFAPASRTAE